MALIALGMLSNLRLDHHAVVLETLTGGSVNEDYGLRSLKGKIRTSSSLGKYC